jgi:biopolymer transport protein ExbD
MAFNTLGDRHDDQELSEINVIPLVDVMLVLLILFIITAPLFTPHAFQVKVPHAATEATQEDPKTIALAIDAKGDLFWGDEKMDASILARRLSEAAGQNPQPPVHLRADAATPYQRIAEVLEAVKKSGIERLGFITRAE